MDPATVSKLDGLFKEQYADNVINLIPEVAKNMKLIPFISSAKENGNKYHQPVIVSAEQGVTYANPNSGAFALEETISMSTADAQVQGNQMVLRSAMSYEAAAKASNNKKAFIKATSLQMDNMIESISKRLEISYLYGQDGLAIITSAVAAGSDVTLTIDAKEWATGIWSGTVNTLLNFYDGSTIIGGANPTVAGAKYVIKTILTSTKQVVVTAADGTAATALVSAVTTPVTAVKAYFQNSFGKEMAGLKKIITNTGTLFNIDASVYDLWKGNVVTVSSGALSFAKVLSAVSQAVQRGLNEKVVVQVNPDTWANLASDLAALRMFDSSYDSKRGKIGNENLTYIGQNGEIEIMSHNIVKGGDCFIFPPKRCKRIGAQDISFNTPGLDEGKIFMQMQNNAGYEYRVYTDQAIFLETPPRAVFVTGFTNSVA